MDGKEWVKRGATMRGEPEGVIQEKKKEEWYLCFLPWGVHGPSKAFKLALKTYSCYQTAYTMVNDLNDILPSVLGYLLRIKKKISWNKLFFFFWHSLLGEGEGGVKSKAKISWTCSIMSLVLWVVTTCRSFICHFH